MGSISSKTRNKGLMGKTCNFRVVFTFSIIFASCVPAFCGIFESKSSRALDRALSAQEAQKYDAAFDAIVESIVDDIHNKNALEKFSDFYFREYSSDSAKIVQLESNSKWDDQVVIYDRIGIMNSSVEKIVTMVKAKYYDGKKNKIAEITDKIVALMPMDITGKRDSAAQKAASAHYDNGVRLAQQENYRQAASEFASASRLVSLFKDAEQMAKKYIGMAEEKDASIHYDSAVALANDKNFRGASEQFTKCISFRPDFKDAKTLAGKYKIQADSIEARTRYESAVQLIQNKNYKDAYQELQIINTLIPGFKDLQNLLKECIDKLPPGDNVVRNAISACLQQSIPVSWVGNLMGGNNAKLNNVEIQKVGIYNEKLSYWPMRIRVAGTCSLNDPFNQGKTVAFDKIGDFRLTRDDYGAWQAVLAEGMFQ
jgi:tetratricopeptide (TPR) repeat protein